MSLELKIREVGDVTILDLTGRIIAGNDLGGLREAIRDQVASGNRKIVLNMEKVSYVDSSGLGEIIIGYGTVTQMVCSSCGATVFKDDQGGWEPCEECNGAERGPFGELRIASPQKQVRDLLQFSNLEAILKVHESVESALKSF